MNDTLASAPHQAKRPATHVGPSAVLRRYRTTLRCIFASWGARKWRERIRVRWQLRQMAKDNPHLIDDIGLTEWQVEAEIAKRFWQR